MNNVVEMVKIPKKKDDTPKTDIVSLVVCPSWGVYFPPYNISRISAVLRQDGYNVFVHDVNVDTREYLMSCTDVDYWSGEKYFHWHVRHFNEVIFPLIQDFIDDKIEEILINKPDIVGFSLYTTNIACSFYMMKKMKEINPNLTIVCGGPECFLEFKPEKFIDYVVVGEGEDKILDIMESYKKEEIHKTDETKIVGKLRTKLDINRIPSPDYSDFNFDLYTERNGVSIETSRGCIAKCTFCTETWFWKYRWRSSDSIIAEMEEQIEKYGISHFWFIDSLINGNLKEFGLLVDGIISNELNIEWNGYARCDARMDLDFLKKVRKAGCTCLSFGIESGSMKVLGDMEKKIKLPVIEQNLKDGYLARIANHTNWVLGFPTEGKLEYYHTLVLVYNCREWIHAISPGMGCGISPNTPLYDRREDFGILPEYDTFLDSWYTSEYKNTKLHRFLRVRLFHIWLMIIENNTDASMINGQLHPYLVDQFKINIKNEKSDVERMEPLPDIDLYHISDGDSFSSDVANEYFPFLWSIYKAFGAFDLELAFDAEKDNAEFGDVIGCQYNSTLSFAVDDDGKFKYNIIHRFNHIPIHEMMIDGLQKNMSFDASYNGEGDFNDF